MIAHRIQLDTPRWRDSCAKSHSAASNISIVVFVFLYGTAYHVGIANAQETPNTKPYSTLHFADYLFEKAEYYRAISADERSAGGDRPVATVVILGGGKGDRLVGSPGVKVSGGWGLAPVRSAREASNPTGRSKSEPEKPRNSSPT